MSKPINITSDVTIGGGAPLALLGGPCIVESEAFTVSMAERIADICKRLGISYVFKASFDKANRTSIGSFRGEGFDAGLAILRKVREVTGCAVVTDIHEPWQAAPATEVADILQIPALLCRQTDLLLAAAASGAAVNVKKGQFLSPPEMRHVVDKVRSGGGDRVLVTERGTTFGYNNLVVDLRSLPQLADTGAAVVFDASHSVQQPGGLDGRSGGQREFVPYLARAAVAVGVDALFMEIHDDPDNAPSDGPNMVPLDALENLLSDLLAIHHAASAHPPRRLVAE
jgi:2-dehydro-3-deoxyphosphooctonate aldolase (KDO 8-P synthase)